LRPLKTTYPDPGSCYTIKNYLFLITALLITGSASAQGYFNGDRVDYNSYYQPRIGFEADVLQSNTMHSDNGMLYFNTSHITSFMAGFTFDVPVHYPLTFATGILYSERGYNASTYAGNYTQRFDCIDVPLLGKFRTGKLFDIYIGPQLSYIIKSTNTYSADFIPTEKGNYSYSGSSTIFEGVAGLAFNVTDWGNIHIKYLTDLGGINSNGNTRIPFYRNNALQIGISFKLFDPLLK
jgi:hypothetical protein